MLKNIMLGAIAGAAGTMALDASTYGDMALTGRASSDLPADMVDKLARMAGIGSLTKEHDETEPATTNRRLGLGALMGYGMGVTIGEIYGAVRPICRGIPWPVMGVVLGAAAMAASDVSAARLEVTDPSTWPRSAWVRDVIPHLAYGLTTAGALELLLPERSA
jgi:hypothetical protein